MYLNKNAIQSEKVQTVRTSVADPYAIHATPYTITNRQ